MRQQIIITIALGVALVITTTVKLIYFPTTSGHTAYYFISIFWICGALVVVFLLNILWHFFNGHRITRPRAFMTGWPNRRKSYRIIYPSYMRPTLFVDTIDAHPKRELEYPVLDLSQNGLCFIDDGSLGHIKSFTGRILFQNGEVTPVAGLVLRHQKDQVSVRLKNGIQWSTILNEQRHLLSQTKPLAH